MGRHRVLRILLVVVAVVAVLVAAWALYFTHRSDPNDVVSYETDNPLITGETLCIAHRSGSGVAPEETLAAFKYCAESSDLSIDVFEFDLHLTADNQLILLHDDSLERTSDSQTVFGESGATARSKTLSELKQLNMGAKFVAEDGAMPYAGLAGDDVPDDLRVATLDEALDYLQSQGKKRFLIEIKNGGEDGKLAADLLADNLERRGLLSGAYVGTFHDEVTAYLDSDHPAIKRCAGIRETIDFYFAAMTGRADFAPNFDMLALPYGNYGVNTGLTAVTNYAHQHGIFVSYWTVNNADDMAYLASIGADGITTDYPDIFEATLRHY